jgi:hypothetical protein
VEILHTYCLVRWWLFRLSFADAVVAARRTQSKPLHALSVEETTRTGIRIGEIVQRTLGPLPLDSRCLVRALVLTRMLARRGIDSLFVLGVRAKPDFAAHAWVERAGVPLLPTAPEFQRLAEV